MANKTPNYGLTKPLPEEFYDIAVHNENMDKIDTELKNHKHTANDVGAVSKHGDIMTGELGFVGGLGKVTAWKNGTAIYSGLDAQREGTIARIQILNGADGKAYPAISYFDGTKWTASDILHTGNKNLISAADVGARPNTWMPTAVDVGAAPAGHVTYSSYFSSDDMLHSKLYYVFENLADETITHAVLFSTSSVTTLSKDHLWFFTVHRRTASHGVVTAVNTAGQMAQAVISDGAWQPWEWVNPPMVSGTEYRTTERIGDKSVYKRINGGIIEYHLDGETTWKPYADAVGALATDGSNAMTGELQFNNGMGKVVAWENEFGTYAALDSQRAGRVARLQVLCDVDNVSPKGGISYFDGTNWGYEELLHSGNIANYASGIEVVERTGTGEYGTVSFTFSKTPKFVVFGSETSIWQAQVVWGCQKLWYHHTNTAGAGYIDATFNGNTVSWTYSSTNHGNFGNLSNGVYKAVAFY